jgi:hypothetical protein
MVSSLVLALGSDLNESESFSHGYMSHKAQLLTCFSNAQFLIKQFLHGENILAPEVQPSQGVISEGLYSTPYSSLHAQIISDIIFCFFDLFFSLVARYILHPLQSSPQ